MADRTYDLAGAVQRAHEFDNNALLLYAMENVEGFPKQPTKFNVKQFGHGQSNPTFLLEVSSEDFAKSYVLRKKPPGELLPSAHAVEREYKVLKALGDHTNVPVPKVFCLCTDVKIIGTAFYIMEYLDGRIFRDPKLPGMSSYKRKLIYIETAKTLASLHKVDVNAIGLGNYGRQVNYCMRQVGRMEQQYLASTGDGKPERNPKMIELANWLKQHIPAEDSNAQAVGLVHGDFRIDNLVFHPVEDRVIGILDWELSTLGTPMCDVVYSCMPFIVDVRIEDATVTPGFEYGGKPDGIPPLVDYLKVYCNITGKPWPAKEWKFYGSFCLFRAVSIYAGVYHRWGLGNASGGDRAQNAGKVGNMLIDAAWSYIYQVNVLPEQPPLAAPDGGSLFHYKRDQSNLVTRESPSFGPSVKVEELKSKLIEFMGKYIYPLEPELAELGQSRSGDQWTIHPKIEELKELAKKEGLWNLWIPLDSAEMAKKLLTDVTFSSVDENKLLLGAGLSNLEYSYLCEVMGRSLWGPEIFNCSAPDTGNMEVLLRYGTVEQQKQWLIPLLEGRIRSAYAMTEPDVASSDATNIRCSIIRKGDQYVINGKKWYISGAMDPRCRLLIVMGKTDFTAPKHKQQSIILVDRKTPGVRVIRPMDVLGYSDAPHGHAEILFENVHVPVSNVVLGEGRGFEIAQGRLGPGRLHHCMRVIGCAARGLEMMVERLENRTAIKKRLAVQELVKVEGHQQLFRRTRQLVLYAAHQLDLHGNKEARVVISKAKVAAPRMAQDLLEYAIEIHGVAGLTQDTVLAQLFSYVRTVRIADGPDEVHLIVIAKAESPRSFSDKVSAMPHQPHAGGGSLTGYPGDESGGVPVGSSGFFPTARVLELKARMIKFMDTYIYPLEPEFERLRRSSGCWTVHPEVENLKELAKKEELWNLWLHHDRAEIVERLLSDVTISSGYEKKLILGAGLSNLEYCYLFEIMGRSLWAPEIFNCSPPDIVNMEVLLQCGTKEQQKQWLLPLLNGWIRSASANTEQKIDSSDATNIKCSVTQCGDHYIINGSKYFVTGAMDPRCRLLIVQVNSNVTASIHNQQSLFLVDMKSAGGVRVTRSLSVFGYEDAPSGHAEIIFENVRVPSSNIIVGDGHAFVMAQGALGLGRLHQCMRLIGSAERGLKIMVERAQKRATFGKLIAERETFKSKLAKHQTALRDSRLLVRKAAHEVDLYGNKEARLAIAKAEVVAPRMAVELLDDAVQVHGAAGLSQDTILARHWVHALAALTILANEHDELHSTVIAELDWERRTQLPRSRL